jgi:hypothetical protein
VAVEAAGGAELKLGAFDDAGWVAYVRDGVALVRRFVPATGEAHPDLGCNVETYCGPQFLELEILAPLRTLAPGDAAELHERWELRPDVDARADALELAAALAAPGDAARA